MSAIAGLWRFDGKPRVDADCSRMLAAQQVYGPHDEHCWSDGALALGRSLYRLLPEDVHDRQPLQSRNGRLTLIADVRLDNRDELIAALGMSPSDAPQLCDAAVLLASLDRWDEGALDRLVGDFAFALWDASQQKLTLARDFLGQRPLHYHRGRNFFAFASMPKGLHALADIPCGPDEETAAEFLTLMPPTSRSFFKDIARVEQAQIVVVTRDGISSRNYWQPRRDYTRQKTADDYVAGVRYHLDQAVQARLRGAGTAVGTNLSGGLDSGAVTATAARLLAPRGGKVIAFTAVPRQGYQGPDRRNRFGDEGPLAAAVAATYPNIEHVLIRSGHISPLKDFDRYFFLFDRPVLNPSNAVWINAIHQAARERSLNVLLVGQMGNMTVSYDGLELLQELLRRGRLIKLWRETSLLMTKTNMSWRGASVRIFGPFMPVALWNWLNETFLGQKTDVLNYTAIRAGHLAELELVARARERGRDFSHRPRKDGLAMRLFFMRRNDNGLLNKGALAGWGVDRRDAFTDKRLVEYCLSIPTEHYLSNGMPRALARRALADRLPPSVLNEQRKGYQAADWHEGLVAARAEIKAELDRLTTCPPATRALDIDRMRCLVESVPASGWERDSVIQAYSSALLRGLAVGHFLRKASGSNQ